MSISIEDVKHIAKLSRLEFNEQELESFKNEMNNIVEYVKQVQNVNTNNDEKFLHVLNAQTELRQDIAVKTFTANDAISNAQEKQDGAFLVPPVIE